MMTDDPYAFSRRDKQELRARFEASQADWRAVRDRLAGNAPALAALDIHQPVTTRETTIGWVACARCWEGGGSDQGDLVEWPCETFAAVKTASSCQVALGSTDGKTWCELAPHGPETRHRSSRPDGQARIWTDNESELP